ncbi:hypothetical protein D3C72_791360 [compost metagenome]
MVAIPAAQAVLHENGEHREQPEPGDVPLTVGNHDRRRQQRAECAAGVTTDLERRLSKAIATARGQTRDAGCLGVEGRRANAHQRRGQQNRREAADHRQHENADQSADHAGRQQPWLGMTIGVVTDPRLQQRSGELEGQGDQANLGESQAVSGLEHRVDRRQHSLNQVVDQMREGTGADHAHHQRAGLTGHRCGGGGGSGGADGHGRSSRQKRTAGRQKRYPFWG